MLAPKRKIKKCYIMKIIKRVLFAILITTAFTSCDDDDSQASEPTVEFINDLFESKTCQEQTTTIQPIVVNWNGTQGNITLDDSLNDPDLQVNQQNGAISYTKELYFGDHYITIKIESNDGSFVKTESFLLKKDISGTLTGKQGTATQVENNQGTTISMKFTIDGSNKTVAKYIDGDLNQWGTFSYDKKDIIIELEGDFGRERVVGNAVCNANPYFDAKTYTYPPTQGAVPNSTPKIDGYIRLYPND